MIYEIKQHIKQPGHDLVLRAGKEISLPFCGKELTGKEHYRLYFTCEDRLHYSLKEEQYITKFYQLIDDSLNPQRAVTQRYALDLSCKEAKPYPKLAMAKLKWPPIHNILQGATDQWELGIFATANNLHIAPGGFLRICLERWEKKEGIDPRLTREAPDETVILDIPAGTYDYTYLSKTVTIPQTTACLTYTVEGFGYTGEIYLEEPRLMSSKGDNACPDFDLCVPNLDDYIWIGQNLSQKEWPEFAILINGREIFRGEKFLRQHRHPSVEIQIPDDLVFQPENTLTIRYISNYREPVPLSVDEVAILSRPKAAFTVSAYPRIAAANKDLCLLLRTEEDNLTLTWESDGFRPVSSLHFEKKGLHPVRFQAVKAENGQTITLSCPGCAQSICIEQLVQKGDDAIICGNSDLIYIDNSNLQEMEDFLEWFFAKEMGELVTIRPIYRWGGQRFINPAVWELLKNICCGMDAKYAHMVDGRDLPGMNCNPHPDMLESENFLGRQLHERDGQVYYWSYPAFERFAITPTFWDVTQRMGRAAPWSVDAAYLPGNVDVNCGYLSLYRNVNCEADMQKAYECAQTSLKNPAYQGNPRHTGPSGMFKYMYQAGWQWLGAETMDSPMEMLLSFHRGAAKAYGQKELGVHHALQWSTLPHDTEPRYRRYLLALYTCYLQGVHQINTEEGLWHLEHGYYTHHRFSEAIKKHQDCQVKMNEYIHSHTRSGSFYTPIGLLQGRYDGWNGFAGPYIHGMPHMPIGEAEYSWELLKVFYPLNNIGGRRSITPKFADGEDNKPRGMYTGTPRGFVDILPVEKADYADYQLLTFLGYNCADPGDFDRLLAFVEQGGTLVTGWPHLSDTTKLDDITNYRHNYLSHPLVNALTQGAPVFEGDRCINPAAGAKVLLQDQNGAPVVYAVTVGSGQIVLINSKLYPANPAIRPVYEQILGKLADDVTAAQPTQALCDTRVQATAYRQEDGQLHYYITPVDWYNEPSAVRPAALRIGKDTYPMQLHFGQIAKVVVNGAVAAWAEEHTAEVLEVTENSCTVQGRGKVTVHIFKNGKSIPLTADCSVDPKQTLVY